MRLRINPKIMEAYSLWSNGELEMNKHHVTGDVERLPAVPYTQYNAYQVWRDMIKRCYNPKCVGFVSHGLKGIKVCKLWRHSFENFFYDIGEIPVGYSLERIDNSKDYSPENCKIIPKEEQSINRSARRTAMEVRHEREYLWDKYEQNQSGT
jgi:hypothetical protein